VADSSNGGAIWAGPDATLTISNSLFANNMADDAGGAIFSLFKTNITLSTFTSNWAGRFGGAIYATGFEIHSSLFFNNTALDSGSAIYQFTSIAQLFNSSANLPSTLIDSKIESNSDSTAVIVSGSHIHIQNSQFLYDLNPHYLFHITIIILTTYYQ